jgi:hypothetical protein
MILLTNFQGTVFKVQFSRYNFQWIKVLFLHIKITEIQIIMLISCYVTQTGVYIYLYITCEINKTLLTRYFMALFITLGLISRPSPKMLSPAQHSDYAQHLSVYAVSCTVVRFSMLIIGKIIRHLS